MSFIRCKTCLIPWTRPDTPFIDGVCAACISYGKRLHIDWEDRRKQLAQLLDRYDGQCIVPSSGGKDSHWQTLKLIEMGAHVTVVVASTCQLTEIGHANINNLARYARTIEITPNRTVRAKLNRLGLTLVGDISWPEHVSIHRTPFKVAAEIGVPLLFYGECPNREYGGPPGSEETKIMTQRWVSEFGGFLGLRAEDLVGRAGLTARDMSDYAAPDPSLFKNFGVEAHFLGQYLEWDSHRNALVAAAHGMKQCLPCPANWWTHENLDNAQTGIHDYVMKLKYGYGRACAQLSVDIRAGIISREEGLRHLAERESTAITFPNEYMGVSFEEICDHIGMTKQAVLDTFIKFSACSQSA